MSVRSLVAGLLLVLGVLLSVPASIAVWQDREVLNEDRFVNSANKVLDDNDVQGALALRMTDMVMLRLDVLAESRPDLAVLQGPIASTIRPLVYDICLGVLRSESFANLREDALRTAHRAVTALLLDDSQFIDQNGERVVLDLRPLTYEVIRELGGESAVQGAQALAGPDFGTVVLVEGSDAKWVREIGDWIDRFNPLVPITAAVVLLLAILVARQHLRMLGLAGGALAVVGALTLLALALPLKELATGWLDRPEEQHAARATYEVFLSSFQRQEIVLILFGIGAAVISVLSTRLRVKGD